MQNGHSVAAEPVAGIAYFVFLFSHNVSRRAMFLQPLLERFDQAERLCDDAARRLQLSVTADVRDETVEPAGARVEAVEAGDEAIELERVTYVPDKTRARLALPPLLQSCALLSRQTVVSEVKDVASRRYLHVQHLAVSDVDEVCGSLELVSVIHATWQHVDDFVDHRRDGETGQLERLAADGDLIRFATALLDDAARAEALLVVRDANLADDVGINQCMCIRVADGGDDADALLKKLVHVGVGEMRNLHR